MTTASRSSPPPPRGTRRAAPATRSTGAEGTYLFTGDTLIRNAEGRWWAGYIEGISDPDSLADSLRLLAGLEPDVVISSAFQGDTAVHRIRPGEWPDHVANALDGLPSSTGNARRG